MIAEIDEYLNTKPLILLRFFRGIKIEKQGVQIQTLMPLLSISEINSTYLKYETTKSALRWIKAKEIRIIKLGKELYVSKKDFEQVIGLMIVDEKQVSITQATKNEQQIAQRLLDKIKSGS